MFRLSTPESVATVTGSGRYLGLGEILQCFNEGGMAVV